MNLTDDKNYYTNVQFELSSNNYYTIDKTNLYHYQFQIQ